MTDGLSLLTKVQIVDFFARLQEHNPNPSIELDFINPFTCLVAVVLSARATDKGVNKVTKRLFTRIKHPQDVLNMGLEAFTESISSIGLYKTKAKHLFETSQILVTSYAGEVPSTREALESLPGVGAKSASVILHAVFGETTFPVDTHVERVSRRTGLVALEHTKTPIMISKALEKIVPQPFRHHAQHWLVLHGRYVCTSQRPRCGACVLYDLCKFEEKRDG